MRPRVHAARAIVPMQIPGASRRAEDVRPNSGSRIVRPSPESGPTPATCLPGCAWRGDFPAGQHLRCGTPPPGPTPHSIDRVLPHSPWAVPDRRPRSEDGRRSLGALLRNTREQCTNLSLPVAPVSPQRADRGQFASLRPACDGLGVDAKHRGDLRGRQQRLGLWCTCGHVRGLSSWTNGVILRFLCCLVLREERVGDVQIWPNRDHIAITSGDASTTRRKVSVPGCPVTPPITVTQGESSDTYRRIAPDSGITVRASTGRRPPSARLAPQGTTLPGPIRAVPTPGEMPPPHPRVLSSPARIRRMHAIGHGRAWTWPRRARTRPGGTHK